MPKHRWCEDGGSPTGFVCSKCWLVWHGDFMDNTCKGEEKMGALSDSATLGLGKPGQLLKLRDAKDKLFEAAKEKIIAERRSAAAIKTYDLARAAYQNELHRFIGPSAIYEEALRAVNGEEKEESRG